MPFAYALLIIFLAVSGGSFVFVDQAMSEPDAIIYEDSITFNEEEDKLSMPNFVMTDPRRNEVYVVDGKSRVMIYSPDLYPLYVLNSEAGVESPQGLALDEEGNLYIAQTPSRSEQRSRISIYKSCLRKERDIFIDSLKGHESFSPFRVAVDRKGTIYVSESHSKGVLVLSNQGELIDVIAPDEEGRRVRIGNVSVDKDGNIYLVSEVEGHVYIYNENRKFVSKFGEKGGSSGKLSRPRAIAIDRDNGKRYIVDYMRHTITVFTLSGDYFHEFGGLGNGEGWFQHPTDLSIDNKGRLFVADLFNNRVQIFKTR